MPFDPGGTKEQEPTALCSDVYQFKDEPKLIINEDPDRDFFLGTDVVDEDFAHNKPGRNGDQTQLWSQAKSRKFDVQDNLVGLPTGCGMVCDALEQHLAMQIQDLWVALAAVPTSRQEL